MPISPSMSALAARTAAQWRAENPEITEFHAQSNGSRIRTFSVDGVKVSVESAETKDDAKAKALTDALAAHTAGRVSHFIDLEARLEAALDKANEMELRAIKAEAKVPPKSPIRVLGTGCVRFDIDGSLWMLNKRETGWSSSGIRLDGWDDLFRRYNVKVTAHGTDKDGAWWEVAPC